MNLKKRVLALVLCIAMIFSVMPTFAGAMVADLDFYTGSTEKYPFEKVEGVYKLRYDWTAPVCGVTVNEDAKIDLNGHVLAINSDENNAYLFIVTGANTELTLTNSVETATKKVYVSEDSGEIIDASEARQNYDYYFELAGGTILVTKDTYDSEVSTPVFRIQDATVSIDGSVTISNADMIEVEGNDYVGDRDHYYDESEQAYLFKVENGTLNLTDITISGIDEEIVRYGNTEAEVSAIGSASVINNVGGTVNLTNCVINACGDVDDDEYEHVYEAYEGTWRGCETPAIMNTGTINMENCRINNAPIYNKAEGKLDLQNTYVYTTASSVDTVYEGAFLDRLMSDPEVAPIYNCGTITVGGTTRVGDPVMEYAGGIVMENGSALKVTKSLATRSGEYTGVASILLARPLVDLNRALYKDRVLGASGVTIEYATGVKKHSYDLGASLFARIAGTDIIDGAAEGVQTLGNAVYEDTPIDAELKDVVLTPTAKTGAFDLVISGLRTEDVTYVQQYLKLLEVLVDSKLDVDTVTKTLGDKYLAGFFRNINDTVFGMLDNASAIGGLKEEFELVRNTFGELDTPEKLGKAVLALALGEFSFEPESDGTAIEIKTFSSGEDFEYGLTDSGRTVTVKATNPKDVSVDAYECYENRGSGEYELEGHYMCASIGDTYFDDSAIETAGIMAALAKGVEFNRAVDMSENSRITEKDKTSLNYFNPFQWEERYEEVAEGEFVQTECYYNQYYTPNADYKVYFVHDINVDLEKHVAAAYAAADSEKGAAAKAAYAEDIKQLTDGQFYLNQGNLIKKPSINQTPDPWTSGLTKDEVAAIAVAFNATTAADFADGKLPEALKFEETYVAPKEVQNYYAAKLATVKSDANVAFEIVYSLLTNGLIADVHTDAVGGKTEFTLLNSAISLTMDGKAGTLELKLDVKNVVESVLEMVPELYKTINYSNKATQTVKKYADILYFDTELNTNHYEYPETLSKFYALIEQVGLDFLGDGSTVAEDLVIYEHNNMTITLADAIGWLKDPSPVTEFVFKMFDDAPAMLGDMGGLARVVEYTPDDAETTAVDEEKILVETDKEGNPVYVQKFSQLLGEYGRYEAVYAGTLASDMLKNVKISQTLMGYYVNELTMGSVIVLPSAGRTPEISAVTVDGNDAKVTVKGDAAFLYETDNGIGDVKVTYWPEGHEDKKVTLTGLDTVEKELTFAREAKNVNYFVNFSATRGGLTYTSGNGFFTVPSLNTADLYLHSAEPTLTLELTDGTETVFEPITEVVGYYKYIDLPEGIYNLSVSNGTNIMTYVVEVKTEGTETTALVNNIEHSTLLTALEVAFDSDLNTEVIRETERKTDIARDAKMQNVIVENLHDNDLNEVEIYTGSTEGAKTADQLKADPNTKLVLEVTNIDKPEDDEEANNIVIAMEENGNNKQSYLDMSIYLRDAADEDNQARVQELENPITVRVPYDTTRSDIHVYRSHEGVVTEIPQGAAQANADGEYFEIDGVYLVLTLKKFSTYAVGYTVREAAKAAFTGGGSVEINNACKQDSACPIAQFTDADPTAWYHDGVHYAIDNGLMRGLSATKFAPNANLSRAMIVTMLYRLDGSNATGTVANFSDCLGDAWYTAAIAWAQANNIVTGYNETTFGPNDNVTREQLAAILYRYAQYKNLELNEGENLSKFDDAHTVSAWAVNAIRWANNAGIINGRTATTIAPKGNATRAEAAAMIQRFAAQLA